MCLLLIGCEEKETYTFTGDDINNFTIDNYSTLKTELKSLEYIVVDLSEMNVLYGKDIDKVIYPASLTKVLTMNAVLRNCNDLSETSSLSDEQLQQLYNDNASLAGIKTNRDYTIEELLYALILPSGGDAAVALENYLSNKGVNLVDEMNKICEELGCSNSHFTNPTGLHDENLYTTLNDLMLIAIDTLQNDVGRQVLKTTTTRMHDGTVLGSTLSRSKNEYVEVLGGKTGSTDESGQSVMIFYTVDNRSYMLIVANAMNPGYRESLHLDDAIRVFEELYKKN